MSATVPANPGQSPEKRPVGRPAKYEPDWMPGRAQELCVCGATDEEIADEFGIDVRTLYRWRNAYPEFRQALKLGKDEPDDRIERSLYQQAMEGNVTAQIFWLKNRRRREWQDGQVVKHELPTAEEVQQAMGTMGDEL